MLLFLIFIFNFFYLTPGAKPEHNTPSHLSLSTTDVLRQNGLPFLVVNHNAAVLPVDYLACSLNHNRSSIGVAEEGFILREILGSEGLVNVSERSR